MKVTDKFIPHKTGLSFEIFPPKHGSALTDIDETLGILSELNPDFISVTFGAGGSSNNNKTIELAKKIKYEYHVEPVVHLTCLTYDKAEELYALSNKMPVRLGVQYENPEISVLLDQYENSVEVPKLTDLSNYWIEMEIAFANIWKGNDVDTEVEAVTQKIMSQLQATE